MKSKNLLQVGKAILGMTLVLFLLAVVADILQGGEPLTLPLDKRPEWLKRDGLVMAFSMEPLLFRVRRDGAPNYTPTAQQREAYLSEYTPEMLARLKDLGLTVVMTHCYKGAGLKAEQESMNDAVEFARRIHDAGMHVMVYNYSGAFIWELFFKEMPQAKEWLILDSEGKGINYQTHQFRYYWNRNHPDAQEFYRKVVKFAVENVKADVIHFDNYHMAPGYDANSIQRFREYLNNKFTPAERQAMGVGDLSAVQPTTLKQLKQANMALDRAWIDFQCQSLADSYWDMCRYARTLRPDVLVECNPMGVRDGVHPPIDHGRLIGGGDGFWDEGIKDVYYRDGELQTRIRDYKVARKMNNFHINYISTPLQVAEAMAFNLDCIGAICEFEYGDLHDRFNRPVTSTTPFIKYVHYFRNRRDLTRDATVIADVAVLRSFPSQVFGQSYLNNRAEQVLIEGRRCFQIVYEQHLADLASYRALVLAGCTALSDKHIADVRRYVESGGRLVLMGPETAFDEWMKPRKQNPWEGLPSDHLVRIGSQDNLLEAIDRVCGRQPSVKITAKVKPPKAGEGLTKLAIGEQLFSDRPYKLVAAPEELIGARTIRRSHEQGHTNAELAFHTETPARVYVAFTPEEKPAYWLKRPPEWQLYRKACLRTTMQSFGAEMDLYYLDVPAGDIRLFEGKRGNYVLVAIQPLSNSPPEEPITLILSPEKEAPTGLCAEFTEQINRRLLHLVNYRSEPVEDIMVSLEVPKGKTVKSVALASPDDEVDVSVPFYTEQNRVHFTVPKVNIYRIAVMTFH